MQFGRESLDTIDLKILSLYQHDTRRIAESIGDAVGLSAAAVQRRLKHLRADGTIAAEIAVVNQKNIGRPITCLVTVSMAGTAGDLDRFKRQMCNLAPVQQCYHVTGSIDFILVVTAHSMEEYGEFARQWFETSQVARYETHVALDRVKVGLSLPISAEEGTN